jgi:uncharacterized protein (TIGR01777 family)
VWNPDREQMDAGALGQLDAIINLAGAGVVDKRWTAERKKEIIKSRVDATYFLHKQLAAHAPYCKAFVAASAIGYYGPDRDGSAPFHEEAPPFNDFLADVCRQWENATQSANNKYRTVVIRIGIVLGKDGGAYPQLAQPLQYGVEPIIGGGKQVVSWVHIEDLASIFIKAVMDDSMKRAYNAVAPAPVTHKVLMDTIAAAKGGKKIRVPVPGFVLKIMMGDASVEVLKSCTVSSKKIEGAGYVFKYPKIEEAVADLVR